VTRKPVLAIPACEAGRGGGHITRCMALVRDLRARKREAFLCIADNEKTKALVQAAQFNPEWIIEKNAHDIDRDWECIVFDRYQTPPEEFSRWKNSAALIGIDEGGPCRADFDFLIDILPGVKRYGGRGAPNIADTSLLPLPEKKERRSRSANAPLRVMVSFGQEDAAGLGFAAANALAARNKSGLLDLSVLTGAAYGNTRHAPAETPAASIPNLAERLGEYDLLVTHYGITAFEALYAATPLVLVSPGAYHEKLAKAAGFYSLGTGKRKAARLARLLFARNGLNDSFLHDLQNRCAALALRHNLSHTPEKTLAALIDGCSPRVSRACTVCGAPLHTAVIGRFHERAYCRCPACGIISMNRLAPPPVEYAREYFFERYQKQYGKNYIEDFPNLVAMAVRRLGHIKKLRAGMNRGGAGAARVLDIGCAYGPFLSAAHEAGFEPFGIDPAEDAVRYVQQNLGLAAIQGSFPDCDVREFNIQADGAALFDAVTLWYVIEHFENCAAALAAIKKLLKPGGILAFSTPSFSGVSGRRSLSRFLENSPADHWTVWSPLACKKALKQAGFVVKKIACTGHHPERFPVLGRFARAAQSPLYGILAAVSRVFMLGDTFEVYALRLE